jgi:hypothetical protein
MPGEHNFEHLPLLKRFQGNAKLKGFGTPSPQTVANRQAAQAHGQSLRTAAQSITTNWQTLQMQRQDQNLPVIPGGIPVLLKVDPSLDLDVLRDMYDFEIVAEQEEGYVIVASRDIELGPFVEMVNGFSVQIHGSATVAKIHQLFDDPDRTDRLRRILSERLFGDWPAVTDTQTYIVDIGIACTGIVEIPPLPNRGKRDSDADWAAKENAWSEARHNAYSEWDKIKLEREGEIEGFVTFYDAEILNTIDGGAYEAAVLPDSFTVRVKISGKGFRDFVLNYPFVFEVVEPEDIYLPQINGIVGQVPEPTAVPTSPEAGAPSVCVIDSGIQEGHILLEPAIDTTTSHCFLPGRPANEVSDFVHPAGHGTRVAGAVLYGEEVAKDGTPQLPFWIQNARVLDENNQMPVELFPPAAMRAAITRFYLGAKNTRLFNHSINARGYCRVRYMSAWAAEIDALSNEFDVLVIQSAGNLSSSAAHPYLGIAEHLGAGRTYPEYLQEQSCRVANPGQSLQALTVGSVAYGPFEDQGWKSFAGEIEQPSAFSRSGFGIWSVIKPEVVEYGGDAIRTANNPPDIQVGGRLPEACPELVRSTMFPPGPAYDRDQAGTSFAAPKVTRIAARLQALLPEEPALLYRALVVQSARWPEWAEALLNELRLGDLEGIQPARKTALLAQTSGLIRCLGYGVPDEERATTNTDHRTTFVTHDEISIHAKECHIYQIPVPQELRNQADEFDIRIDVTLSYVAQPRRTRRNLRRYLSTWVEWKSNKLGEHLNDFRRRAMKDVPGEAEGAEASVLPWTLHEGSGYGYIRDTRRNAGTVQKDWAVVKSNKLPDQFCIAVVGHNGWSHDPDSAARYTMAVTFEILGQEITIYEPLRNAIIALQAEVEAEVEAEIEVDE